MPRRRTSLQSKGSTWWLNNTPAGQAELARRAEEERLEIEARAEEARKTALKAQREADRLKARMDHMAVITIGNGIPQQHRGFEGEFTLRSLSTGIYLFIRFNNKWYKISQCTFFNDTGDTEAQNNMPVNLPNETFDNVSINSLTGGIVWAEFPFTTNNMIYNRYYFRDVDDIDDFRRWDSNDTSPTGFNYRNVSGSYTVPEDCTLLAMSGIIACSSGTQNPTVYVFTGSVTEGTGDTTLASAGSTTVTVGTANVPNKFSSVFSVDLLAGDVVIPMIRNENSGTTPDYYGSLTLKFKNR